ETWAPEQVQAPDTTMVALAPEALRDLRERMAQAPTSTLEGRISRALDVLHALMASAPLRALACLSPRTRWPGPDRLRAGVGCVLLFSESLRRPPVLVAELV